MGVKTKIISPLLYHIAIREACSKSTMQSLCFTRSTSKCEVRANFLFDSEEELTSVLIEMAKIGYAHTRKQIIALVQLIVESKGIETVVSSGRCGRDNYIKRHTQIVLRVTVQLSMARAMAYRDVLDWYILQYA